MEAHPAGTKHPETNDDTFVRVPDGLELAGLPLKYSPRPLVYQNNWKPVTDYDRLAYGYTIGFVLVLGKYALGGDRVAITCLRERLGELRREFKESRRDKDRRRTFSVLKKSLYYFWGFVPAVYFRLAGDVPWPKNEG